MEDKNDRMGNWIIGIAVFLVVLVFIFGTFYTIPAGYRGVLLTFGKPSMDAKGEGLHVKFPLVQKIVKMDTRTQKYEASLSAASKDLQDVSTIIAINYHIVPESTPSIYQSIGTDYAEKVIYPYEQETNKAATAQFTAEELIHKRDDVTLKMKSNLVDKLRVRNIIVEEISIIDFKFSPSFTQAIELKVTAEQNALAAKNKLEQIKYEAQQKIEAAKGDATKIRLIEAQLKQSPSYIEWLKVDKWNGQLPAVTSGIPFINVASYTGESNVQVAESTG